MNTLSSRRQRNLATLIGLVLVFGTIHQVHSVVQFHTNILWGWVLFFLILFLAMYNLRKRLPFLPLGSSAFWLQCHMYTGILTGVVFLLHINLRFPNGLLEVALALIFLFVVGSGILGLVVSRILSRRLTTRGAEVIYERIPALRKELREKVEDLVFEDKEESRSTVLGDFYLRHLADFFLEPQNCIYHLLGSQRPRQAMLANLIAQDCYFNAQEREKAKHIHSLICAKDDLDLHSALQGTLKTWSFLHVPLTYSLLMMSLFHAMSIEAFSAH